MALKTFTFSTLIFLHSFFHSTEGDADKEDSNLLPDDHDILSDVIEEEFGGSLTGRGKRNLHEGNKKPDVTERCFVLTEPPTRDTDVEVSRSCVDILV